MISQVSAPSATVSPSAPPRRSSNIWAGRLRRGLLGNPTSLVGLVLLAVLAAAALLAPVIAPYDPLDQDLVARLQPPTGPGGAPWLGTDQVGRDVLSRLIF